MGGVSPRKEEFLDIGGRGVRVSSPDKVVFPEPGITKLEIVEYYVAVADADSLAPIDVVKDRAVVAVAARIGKTRLIDNVVLGEDRIPAVG